MIIYGDVDSGNCYKIKLLLSLLNIHHRWIHVDILNKDTQTAEFLSLNPTLIRLMMKGIVLCKQRLRMII